MKKFLIRWAINALALAATVWILNKYISYANPDQALLTIVIWSLIFGLVNAIIRPVVKVLTCLPILLTLGLFTLIINTLMFILANWIATQFNIGLVLGKNAGVPFWIAFFAALILSVISFVLSKFLYSEKKKKA
jgi:putative membrane protein